MIRKTAFQSLFFLLFFLVASLSAYAGMAMPSLSITSPLFEHSTPMPPVCTCQGENKSPSLVFLHVPENARSLALIIDDPDAPDPAAPKRTFVHWVLFNMPPTTPSLDEGTQTLPEGSLQGINDAGTIGYTGPCPPIGTHRYFHKLYALNTVLPLQAGATKQQLLDAMHGHIIAEAQLIGTYKK